MNFPYEREQIDRLIPGVTEAYGALQDSQGLGIYTSVGAFYNHTIFGRDVAMSAKFVSDFDHQTVWNTIRTLASLQGIAEDRRTQEQSGRIHHELRDYKTWTARPFDRVGMWIMGHLWGVKNQTLLTYYAADTTANYIRLVNKYTGHIDASVLSRQVPDKNGGTRSLAESVADAADWITRCVDDNGYFSPMRTNRLSLPYQTFQDSVTAYAWADRRPIDTSRPHSFVETQAFAIDALEDALRMLQGHHRTHQWRFAADSMLHALMHDFWDEGNQFFASMVAERDGGRRRADVPNVSAGWTLNTSFWDHLPEVERVAKITAIVTRLFSPEFLTDIGLRTRSMEPAEPLGITIDYHGAQTVWPMFTFMVIEGLRRHRLYRLAEQLENRMVNGVNALGNFYEFFMINKSGHVYLPQQTAAMSLPGQMVPEKNIAFTVVPMMTLAYRRTTHENQLETDGWQAELEKSILEKIAAVPLLAPEVARAQIVAEPLRLRRFEAGMSSLRYILPVILRKPQ